MLRPAFRIVVPLIGCALAVATVFLMPAIAPPVVAVCMAAAVAPFVTWPVSVLEAPAAFLKRVHRDLFSLIHFAVILATSFRIYFRPSRGHIRRFVSA